MTISTPWSVAESPVPLPWSCTQPAWHAPSQISWVASVTFMHIGIHSLWHNGNTFFPINASCPATIFIHDKTVIIIKLRVAKFLLRLFIFLLCTWIYLIREREIEEEMVAWEKREGFWTEGDGQDSKDSHGLICVRFFREHSLFCY